MNYYHDIHCANGNNFSEWYKALHVLLVHRSRLFGQQLLGVSFPQLTEGSVGKIIRLHGTELVLAQFLQGGGLALPIPVVHTNVVVKLQKLNDLSSLTNARARRTLKRGYEIRAQDGPMIQAHAFLASDSTKMTYPVRFLQVPGTASKAGVFSSFGASVEGSTVPLF